MESLKKTSTETGVKCFQMPLHYPRYTKEDYLDMPEWKLDQLLLEYGLSAHGDLPSKREYAIGAFLWPDFHCDTKSSSPIYRAMVNNASLLDKKIK